MEHVKRPKKPNFSNAEMVKLVEMVSVERNVLLNTCQDGATIKRKQEIWRNITSAVNAIGGQRRQEAQVRKKWKDMKTHVLNKPAEEAPNAACTCQHLDIPCEEIIRNILQSSGQLLPEMPPLDSAVGGEASYPEGAVTQSEEPSEMGVPPFHMDGQGVNGVSLPSTTMSDIKIPITAITSRVTATTSSSSSSRRTSRRLGFQSMKKSYLHRRLRPATKVLYADSTHPPPPASPPCSVYSDVSGPMDSDDVWLQWMQSEISKNKVKQQLMAEKLLLVRDQRSMVELQKKEMLLKIQSLQHLQGNGTAADYGSHLDSQSEDHSDG